MKPAAAAAKSLRSCPTLCDPIDGSTPGSPEAGILQARTLEWVAISFSNAWKWKVKVKSLSRVRPSATPWTAAYQASPSIAFSRHSIFQARVLEWFAIAFSGHLCQVPLNLKLYSPWPSTSKPVRHCLHKLIINQLLFGILLYPWTLSCNWDNVLWFKCTYFSRCFSYSLKFRLWKSIMVLISDTTT